jgi:RNA polymerase sigma-70 factor (ECF subfamily)
LTEREADLISRAQTGETDAFCELAKSYERRIYSLASHYCQNAQDAEDLSQEVWLKAYQALSSFRFASSFYTWLRRITINTFLNHQRALVFHRRGQETTIQFVTTESSGSEPQCGGRDAEISMTNKVLIEKVNKALSGLSSRQRLIFLLKHHEGMTYEEIARAIGCSTGTVKKALARAIAKLRGQLDANVNASDRLSHAAVEYRRGVCDA